MHLRHLQGVSSLYYTEITHVIKVTISIKSVDKNVTVIVGDKVQSIEPCELWQLL